MLRRFFLVWHRRIGILSALFVVILSITGIILNRTVDWELDQKKVQWPALNQWYGLSNITTPPLSFKAGAEWITSLEKTLYLNAKPINTIEQPPTGAIALEDGIIITFKNELTLYSTEGDIFDQKNSEDLPGQIKALALHPADQTKLIIKTNQGSFTTTSELESWTPFETEKTTKQPVKWATPQSLPAPLKNKVFKAHASRGVPLSHVLLDVHSGRIFGTYGPYVMDAAAILLLLLTATGIYNWSKARR